MPRGKTMRAPISENSSGNLAGDTFRATAALRFLMTLSGDVLGLTAGQEIGQRNGNPRVFRYKTNTRGRFRFGF